jgi:hypothetical protein
MIVSINLAIEKFNAICCLSPLVDWLGLGKELLQRQKKIADSLQQKLQKKG